jgi:hypothetical protein
LSGKQNAALDFYVKIAHAFGGDDAVLEIMREGELLSEEVALKGSLLELFKAVMRLSPEQQEQFMVLGRVLAEQEKQRKAPENSNLATDSGSTG